MDWIEALKVGDKVARSFWYGRETLGVVEKITPTQVVVDGTRYRKKDGWTVGAYRGKIVPLTEAIKERLLRDHWVWQVRRAIDATNFHDLPVADLQTIFGLLQGNY